MSSRVGRPTGEIRWTISCACKEFGFAYETLSNRIRQESLEPGKDGCYSTPQMVQAIFGDNESVSRVKLNKARTTLAELDIEVAREERMLTETVIDTYDKVTIEVKQILKSVVGKTFDEPTAADILKAFQQIPIKLKFHSAKKTKALTMEDPFF